MKTFFFLLCVITSNAIAHDFSGRYECDGKDASEGAYKGEVIMNLKKQFTQKDYASYDFVLKVPGFGEYNGFAAANNLDVAIYFGLDDKQNEDYGVGIAKFSKTKNNLWQFHKFYFEPGYKGGNTGFEDCIQVK